MKNKLLLFAMAFFAIMVSCNEDDGVAVTEDQRPFVSFSDVDFLDVAEGAQIEISVFTDNPSSSPITIDYQLNGNTSGINVLSGSQITIPANQSEGTLIIEGIDDTTAEEDDEIEIELTGNSQGYSVGFLTDRSYKKTITRRNDDCDPIPAGTYTTSNTGTYDGDHTVTITQTGSTGDTFTYALTDITGGTYEIGYGASDNPGVITQTACSITMDPADNPDVVYGGDQFTGSGNVLTVGSESFTISWSNTFGDNGVTVFVKQ